MHIELKERLLVEHFLRKALGSDNVIHVPGLGTFFHESESQSNSATYKTIGFESGFERGGKDFSLLFSEYQKIESIEGKIIINRYVDWLAETIQTKPVEIEGIGWLSLESETGIIFSLAPPSIHAGKLIEPEKDSSPLPNKKIKPVSDNTQFYILVGVIILTLLVLYSIGIFNNESDISREPRPGSDSLLQDSLPFDTTSESFRYEQDRLARQRLSDSVTKALEKEQAILKADSTSIKKTDKPVQKVEKTKSEISKPITPTGNFMIIVGSFQDKKVAEKLKIELTANGFITSMFSQGDDKWRVSAGSFSTYDEAKKLNEQKIKPLFPGAWIFEKK
jgi:hypothetical protein